MIKKFSNKKVKILVKDDYLEDLKRNGVLIMIWNKSGLYFHSCSVRSDELDQDINGALEKLSAPYVNSPQGRRWFRKIMNLKA